MIHRVTNGSFCKHAVRIAGDMKWIPTEVFNRNKRHTVPLERGKQVRRMAKKSTDFDYGTLMLRSPPHPPL